MQIREWLFFGLFQLCDVSYALYMWYFLPNFWIFSEIDVWNLHQTPEFPKKYIEQVVLSFNSVVTWFFFCKFCPIFREFKANLIVTWLKCVGFLGYPSLARKMGKWEKQVCFSKELALYKMRFVYYDLSSKKWDKKWSSKKTWK